MCCHVANENAFNKCTDTVHSAATLYDRSTSTADLCACHTWIFHKFTVNMVRVVHGANGVFMVEIVNGTKIRDTSQAINSVPMPTLLLCHCSFVVMTPKKHCNLFRKLAPQGTISVVMAQINRLDGGYLSGIAVVDSLGTGCREAVDCV